MSHKNKIKLRKWATNSLYGKWQQGRGMAKHSLKDSHNATPYIHSESTYKTYRKQINHFVDWCYDQGIRTPEAAREAVPAYMAELQQKGQSAWSQHTALAAIAKCYDCHMTDFKVTLPDRERHAVSRSRYIAKRDAQLDIHSADVQAQIAFCRATGLRRRELEALTGDKLITDQGGMPRILVTNGKGGKTREVEIYGTPEQIQWVKDTMYLAGEGKVFSHVHTKLDVHSLRAEYACSMYRKYARPLDTLSRSERYCCRKDRAGITYDKVAMGIVSRNLGHNRINVIAESYLYRL